MNDAADESGGDDVKSLTTLMKDGAVMQAELGFAVDVKRAEKALRGHYDVSVLQRDNPQLVNLITWLLSLPGMTIQAIAESSGMAWESVAAIQARNKVPIREFKLRACDKLALVLDASFGGLMKQAAEGKIKAFDFKLLVDAWQQLSGEGHVMRFEGARQEDPKREAFRKFMESGGSGMVLEGEVIPQMAALPGALDREAVEMVAVPELVVTGDFESPEHQA